MIAAAIVGLTIGYIGVTLAAFHLYERTKKLENQYTAIMYYILHGEQQIMSETKEKGDKPSIG